MPDRDLSLPYSDTISLSTGGEEDVGPFALEAGDVVHLRAEANVRFYLGWFDEATYRGARQSAPSAFPFRFGTDERLVDRATPIPARGNYWLVVRIGGWTAAGTIRLHVTRMVEESPARPGRGLARAESVAASPSAAAPAPSSGPAAARVVSPTHSPRERARRWVVGLSVGALVLLAILTWVDYLVLTRDGLDTFDNTLSAEATALGVVLAVIGGIVAAYTFFGPKAGSGGS